MKIPASQHATRPVVSRSRWYACTAHPAFHHSVDKHTVLALLAHSQKPSNPRPRVALFFQTAVFVGRVARVFAQYQAHRSFTGFHANPSTRRHRITVGHRDDTDRSRRQT